MGGPIEVSDSRPEMLPARIASADAGLEPSQPRDADSVWKDVDHSIYGTWKFLMGLFGAFGSVVLVTGAESASLPDGV